MSLTNSFVSSLIVKRAAWRSNIFEKGGPALFAEISPSGLIFYKVLYRLYERRASPPSQDFAIQNPRSRLRGLEISQVNAIKRAKLPVRAGGIMSCKFLMKYNKSAKNTGFSSGNSQAASAWSQGLKLKMNEQSAGYKHPAV